MHTHAKHTIHRDHIHHGWNNAFPPRLKVAPGEIIRFETKDPSSGQLTPASTTADIATLDFSLFNPVTGPVFVDGAKPVEVAVPCSRSATRMPQGDGEVCGSAIESPMGVVLQFEVLKNTNLKMPRYVTPGPVTDHFDKKGYGVTTGIGPDLMTGARLAVSEMVDLFCKRFGYSAIDAYMLSFCFPRIVLE